MLYNKLPLVIGHFNLKIQSVNRFLNLVQRPGELLMILNPTSTAFFLKVRNNEAEGDNGSAFDNALCTFRYGSCFHLPPLRASHEKAA